MPNDPNGEVLTPEESSSTIAEVRYGQIPSDVLQPEDDALYDESEIGDGIFTDYVIHNQYESDGQIYMMPVTSPGGFDGDSVAFVKLAGGTLLWICDWTAEKIGAPPSIPNPDIDDPNLVLLDSHCQPAGLLKRPDDSIIYRISGTFIYGYKNPSQAVFYYGRPPWMAKSVDCALSQSQFRDGIITCNTSTGAGGSENQGSPGATATYADLGIEI